MRLPTEASQLVSQAQIRSSLLGKSGTMRKASPEELKSVYQSSELTTRLGTASAYSLKKFDPNEALMHQKLLAQQSQRILKSQRTSSSNNGGGASNHKATET